MLPFPPERMERLLDKALDWIERMESGADLYDTLKFIVGMTDYEISAAGFDGLEQYFGSHDADETDDLAMQQEVS